MKNKFLRIIFLFYILFFLFPAAAQAYDQPKLVAVYINGELEYDPHPVYLTATAVYTDGQTRDVTYSGEWKSLNPNIASVHRGKVEFQHSTGNLTISFTLADKEVTIGTEVFDLVELTITPATLKYSEKPVQLKASGLHTNGNQKDVTEIVKWYSTNEEIVRVDYQGQVRFTGRAGKSILGALFVSPLTQQTLQKEIEVTVSEAEVDKGPIRPSMAFEIKIEGQLDPAKKTNTLKAYRLYIDDSKESLGKDQVSWFSSNPNIATVDENGKVSFTGRAGQVKIYARDSRYSDKQASVEAYIPYEYLSLVINESLNYTPFYLKSPPTLTVTGLDNNGLSQLVYGLEWTSSNPEIASVNKQGQVLFTGRAGSVTITATKDALSASIDCLVPEEESRRLTSIKISNNLFYQNTGQRLRAMAIYSDGTTVDITDDSQWQSSNDQIALVNRGEVFFSGLPGQVSITARFQAFSDSVETAVRAGSSSKQLTAIKFEKNFLTDQDDNQPLKVLGLYTDNSSQQLNNVKFHSYQPNIAQVSNNRLILSGNPGTAILEASAGNFRTTIEINISKPQGIQLPLFLRIDGELDYYLNNKVLKAKAIYADGKEKDITQDAIWNTTNKNIANLTGKGLVEILGNGPYRITAAYKDQIAYLSNNNYSLYGKLHPIKTSIVNLEKLKKDFSERLSLNLYLPPIIDINQHWAEKDIRLAYQLGWLGGYPDGTMKPDRIMTRGEFASILERALSLKTNSSSFKYSDTDNHWARRSISTIANLGLVPVDTTRNFRPDDPLTRSEMAQIINNIIELRADRYYPFLDVPPSHPARGAIANLTQAKIISGIDSLHFKPNEPATRAQTLAVILRLIKTDPELLAILNK